MNNRLDGVHRPVADWERLQALVRAGLPDTAAEVRLDPESNLIELGLDSLGMLNLIMAIEQEFDVVLPDDALTIDVFRTMGSVWGLLKDPGSATHG
jgi:acyl carrier protein